MRDLKFIRNLNVLATITPLFERCECYEVCNSNHCVHPSLPHSLVLPAHKSMNDIVLSYSKGDIVDNPTAVPMRCCENNKLHKRE